jgi:hypothetical protein
MAKQFVGFFSFLLSLPLGWAIFELYKDNDAFDLSFLKEHESIVRGIIKSENFFPALTYTIVIVHAFEALLAADLAGRNGYGASDKLFWFLQTFIYGILSIQILVKNNDGRKSRTIGSNSFVRFPALPFWIFNAIMWPTLLIGAFYSTNEVMLMEKSCDCDYTKYLYVLQYKYQENVPELARIVAFWVVILSHFLVECSYVMGLCHLHNIDGFGSKLAWWLSTLLNGWPSTALIRAYSDEQLQLKLD